MAMTLIALSMLENSLLQLKMTQHYYASYIIIPKRQAFARAKEQKRGIGKDIRINKTGLMH
jgi:hypothetical protein